MSENLDKPLTARELETRFGIKPRTTAPADAPGVPLHVCNEAARAHDASVKAEKDELGTAIKKAVDVVMGKRRDAKRVQKNVVTG